jgi:4-hydroxybenzoate polyprenyltransferase
MTRALEVIKVSRPGFWPTHIWFYLLPFAQQDMFGSFAFWLGAIYVCFPMGLLIFGWNDLGDAETDTINPRKDSWLFGASPDASLRRHLPWIIAAVQIPFLIAFVQIGGWKMVIWFVALIAANATYNSLGCKKLPLLDLLNQIGYLLVFVLASWLCSVKQLNGPAMLFSAFFAMHSHLFGQIMDIDEDQVAGRRSTAVTIGVTNSKLLLVAILLAEASIAAVYFRGWIISLFMLAAAVFFIADAFFGPKRYPLSFVKTFFIGWNLIAILTMHIIWRYGLFVLAA